MAGPAWLGIGGHRCGTTWFTDLLRQHPQVDLAVKGRKELHELYLPLVRAYETEGGLAHYRSLFADPGDHGWGSAPPSTSAPRGWRRSPPVSCPPTPW